MTETRCPSCGREVPAETGQHALTPSAGIVACPHCGAEVTLPKPGAEPERAERGPAGRAKAAPPGRTEGGETFSGEETVEGVMKELSEKEGGPQ